jgi:2-polyprenyl-3-methyl-5-hydroxy-6-metoxy-1,4-benzoquinol methylase
LGYRDPLTSESELQAYYHSGYRIELGKGKRPSKHRLWRLGMVAAIRARDVLPRLPAGARTLDIGCGAGDFVYMLASAGCDARGFDPDSHYMAWAQGLLDSRVERNRIEDVQIAPGSLDAVTIFHAMEHMRDPLSVFRRVNGWLGEGGLFVVEVPNLQFTLQAPGHQYQKGHLFYFNRMSLMAMGTQAGFRVEDGGYDLAENLCCYFRKASAARPMPTYMPENARAVLAILRKHRPSRHYFKTHPYRRVWYRFSRTISEYANSATRDEAEILQTHAQRLKASMKPS